MHTAARTGRFAQDRLGYSRRVAELTADWRVVFDVELSGLSAPQQARWMIREQLASSVSQPFLRDVMLATSEVVTNAIRYAPGPLHMTLQRDQASTRIRVGVVDTSPDLPRRSSADDDPATTGRGLLIVDTVASSWGARPLGTGKEIWFEMVPDERS